MSGGLLALAALSLHACDDEAEALDELVLADDDVEEIAEAPPTAAPLAGPDDLAASVEATNYCIPQTWSTCGPSNAYNCCPPDAPFGATCYWRSCEQHILDENCVVHSSGYVSYSGCATG